MILHRHTCARQVTQHPTEPAQRATEVTILSLFREARQQHGSRGGVRSRGMDGLATSPSWRTFVTSGLAKISLPQQLSAVATEGGVSAVGQQTPSKSSHRSTEKKVFVKEAPREVATVSMTWRSRYPHTSLRCSESAEFRRRLITFVLRTHLPRSGSIGNSYHPVIDGRRRGIRNSKSQQVADKA